MAQINAPGVYATINTRPLGQPAPPQGSDAFFVVGWAVWGEVGKATLVTSWKDFETKFGGFHPNSELANQIYLFFKNNGRRAWVVRVAKNATKASLVLSDRHATPQPVVKVTAKHPSATVDIKVTIDESHVADDNTVDLIFESVRLNRRERFNNFKVAFTAAEQAAIQMGLSPFNTIEKVSSESKLVSLSLEAGNTHSSPDNLPKNPADNARTLTGGADNIANVVTTDVTTALDAFSEELGPGQVATCGFPLARLGLIQHAETAKRIAILETAADEDVLDSRSSLDSPYAAMYFPNRVKMFDLAGSGGIRNYATIGAIAGVFAQAEFEVGIHKAPANYRLADVLDVVSETAIGDGLRETLNERQINTIAPIPGQGIKVYGARILRGYGQVTAIHQQRVLNEAYYRLKRSLQGFVFQPANPALFREIRSTCAQYLRELYREGALYSPTGNEEDAYVAICDETNNTPEQLQQNRVVVDVYVRIVGMAEMILLQISNVPLATQLSVLGEQQ